MSVPDAATVLFSLAVVIVVCQVAGAVARRLGQPAVIGEIVGGILLGPTLFGGRLAGALFPAEVRPLLGALANVGVALFMFLVGLEFDRRVLRRDLASMGWLGLGSLALPFGLGALLGVGLLARHPTGSGGAFVVFLGTAMAVTAFPVLARIITDRGLLASRVGGLALALAALGDVVAWTVLAVVVAVHGSGGPPWRLLLLVPYGLVVLLVVPRVLRSRTVVRLPRPVVTLLAVTGALASGAATEWFGLHLIFGAFLFGLATPGTGLRGGLRRSIEHSVRPLAAFFMPIYFVVAGFRVDLSHVGAAALGELALVVLVALGGKVVGVYAGARAARMGHHGAALLATLMNVRGLTELVLLTVGLDLRIIDADLYGLMVIMAVLTTVASGPVLSRLLQATPGTSRESAASRRTPNLAVRRPSAPKLASERRGEHDLA